MARVTLTFDNGPHPEGTPRVLEVLQRRGLRGTFFVVGKALAAPGGLDLARRARDEGHRLGNHTFHHDVPLGRDDRPGAVDRELTRTQALLDQVWEGPLLFRPFGGKGAIGPHLLSPAAVRWLEARRGTCVLWNVVPGDFRDPTDWVSLALDQVPRHEHALVVLHDLYPEAMRGLDGFIGRLLDDGHTLVSEFPASCLPMVDGRAGPGLDAIVEDPGQEARPPEPNAAAAGGPDDEEKHL